MLKFKDVTFAYEEAAILNKVSFNVNKGDFVSLIGKSGCGKSTIFRLILGFESPQGGAVEFSPAHKDIGFMPQKDMLFAWRTVKQNLALPLEVKNMPKQAIDKQVDTILKDMELAHTKNLYPSELSGGMRQRIAFARTVLTGAELLLLDEPFSALDYFTRLDFQEWILNQYQRLNKTIFFITHSVDEALLLSNRIFVFERAPTNSLKEITIRAPYPRSQEFLASPEMLNLKKQLVHDIRFGGGADETA